MFNLEGGVVCPRRFDRVAVAECATHLEASGVMERLQFFDGLDGFDGAVQCSASCLPVTVLLQLSA